MIPDQSWFYSSLAQVTAALVAFLGGFLILRLLDHIKEWNDLRTAIELAQPEWLHAKDREDEQFKAEGKFDAEIARRENEAWGRLVRLLERREKISMPKEVLLGAIILLALLCVGAVWPLLFLQAPSAARKLIMLVPWAIVLIAFFALMFGRACLVLSQVKALKLWQRVEAEYEHHQLQVEMWEEQE